MQEYFNDPVGAFVSGMVQDIVCGNSSCFPRVDYFHLQVPATDSFTYIHNIYALPQPPN